MKEEINFEKYLLSKPETFFSTIEHSLDFREKIILGEYFDWQTLGGKNKDIRIRIIGENKDILTWNFGEEHHAQKVDKLAPFTLGEHKNALVSVFSFMEDRPQYYKFRKMEGIFNPLKTLLFALLTPQ